MFPFFKDTELINGKGELYFYEIDPIEDLSYYIEIGVEDLLEDSDLFNYVIKTLTYLFKEMKLNSELKCGLYICITPGLKNVPILIVIGNCQFTIL